MSINTMTVMSAVSYLKSKGCVFEEVNANLAFAICVTDEVIHGAILMRADGLHCELACLYTDGTAQAGSLLYGAAWRAAKALGYKKITL